MVDSNLTELFGGSTRTRTLAILANAAGPMTGYRIALTARSQPIKTNAELKRLDRLGLVSRRPTSGGRLGWVLTDQDLTNFLRRRVRLSSIEDWNSEVDKQSALGKEIVVQLGEFDLGGYPSRRRSLDDRAEFERPASKDRALKRLGLRPSRRGKTR